MRKIYTKQDMPDIKKRLDAGEKVEMRRFEFHELVEHLMEAGELNSYRYHNGTAWRAQ